MNEHNVWTEIKIRKEGDRYIAELFDGWWSASGKTEKEAIKRVKKRFYEEQERML